MLWKMIPRWFSILLLLSTILKVQSKRVLCIHDTEPNRFLHVNDIAQFLIESQTCMEISSLAITLSIHNHSYTFSQTNEITTFILIYSESSGITIPLSDADRNPQQYRQLPIYTRHYDIPSLFQTTPPIPPPLIYDEKEKVGGFHLCGDLTCIYVKLDEVAITLAKTTSPPVPPTNSHPPLESPLQQNKPNPSIDSTIPKSEFSFNAAAVNKKPPHSSRPAADTPSVRKPEEDLELSFKVSKDPLRDTKGPVESSPRTPQRREKDPTDSSRTIKQNRRKRTSSKTQGTGPGVRRRLASSLKPITKEPTEEKKTQVPDIEVVIDGREAYSISHYILITPLDPFDCVDEEEVYSIDTVGFQIFFLRARKKLLDSLYGDDTCSLGLLHMNEMDYLEVQYPEHYSIYMPRVADGYYFIYNEDSVNVADYMSLISLTFPASPSSPPVSSPPISSPPVSSPPVSSPPVSSPPDSSPPVPSPPSSDSSGKEKPSSPPPALQSSLYFSSVNNPLPPAEQERYTQKDYTKRYFPFGPFVLALVEKIECPSVCSPYSLAQIFQQFPVLANSSIHKIPLSHLVAPPREYDKLDSRGTFIHLAPYVYFYVPDAVHGDSNNPGAKAPWKTSLVRLLPPDPLILAPLVFLEDRIVFPSLYKYRLVYYEDLNYYFKTNIAHHVSKRRLFSLLREREDRGGTNQNFDIMYLANIVLSLLPMTTEYQQVQECYHTIQSLLPSLSTSAPLSSSSSPQDYPEYVTHYLLAALRTYIANVLSDTKRNYIVQKDFVTIYRSFLDYHNDYVDDATYHYVHVLTVPFFKFLRAFKTRILLVCVVFTTIFALLVFAIWCLVRKLYPQVPQSKMPQEEQNEPEEQEFYPYAISEASDADD